jgi:preprotein translocase subunit SecA
LVEYKNEAYNAFRELTSSMYEDYLRTLLRIQVAVKQENLHLQETRNPLEGKVSYSNPEKDLESTGVASSVRKNAQTPAYAQQPAADASSQQQSHASAVQPGQTKTQTYVKDKEDPFANVGRNDPCPCGSGKKFKKCHGV